MNNWEREGLGLKKTFPVISSSNATPVKPSHRSAAGKVCCRKQTNEIQRSLHTSMRWSWINHGSRCRLVSGPRHPRASSAS